MTDLVTGNQIDIAAFDSGMSNDDKRKQLRGTRFADWVEDRGRDVVSGLHAASQDQEGIGDDILRGAGKVLQGAGAVAEAPVIKQGLQLLDAPFHYGSKLAGAAAERMGVDPRLGEWAVRTGELATGVGALKKAPKVAGKVSNRLAREATEFAFRHADPQSVAGMVYRTGGGMGPVPQHLTKIVKSGKDVAKELAKSPNYKALNKKYKYIKPEEFANSPNLKKFLYREQVLGDSLRQVKKWEDAREIAKKIPKDKRGRLLKSTEKNVKTSRRTTLEHASLNLLDDEAKHIFFMNRNELKKGLSEFFAAEGTEWHHLFGNKETGNLFLNEIAQDTMITANLMEHLKKLKLSGSGVRKNLTAMMKDPHNELHTMFRKMGFEQGKELDFADYMQDIAKNVALGNTDVNEFFTMLEVYSNRTMPWLKKKAKSFGGKEFTDIPMEPYLDKYQGVFQKKLDKVTEMQNDLILKGF